MPFSSGNKNFSVTQQSSGLFNLVLIEPPTRRRRPRFPELASTLLFSLYNVSGHKHWYKGMYKPVKAEAQALRRYKSETVLEAISRASTWRRKDAKSFAKTLAEENLDYGAALRDYQLAFAAKLALYLYDKKRLSTRRFDWKDLVQTCRSLTKHQDPASYPIRSAEDFERFMIRAAYQQFPDFYGDNDTLARTRLLFRTCAKTVVTKTQFDIDKAYKEATGLTLDQTWDLTLALLGLILSRNGGIQPGLINPGDLRQNISEADVNRFVYMISVSPQEFRTKMQLPEYRVDPMETFNPNPLVNWPMIRLANSGWVVPIVPYLFRRGTEQVFYDVIKRGGREFAGFFGHVFEEYVDRILSTLGPSYEVVRERRYVCNGQPYDTCDRIILNDGDAILLECKTKRLGLRTKFTADKELLRKDLTDIGKSDDKSNLVHAVRQLHRTHSDIRANRTGLEDLHVKITGTIYPLVLVLDPYYFANAPYIKSIVSEELRKSGSPIVDFSWQVLDARGFEPLCALARQEDFKGLLARKFSSPELAVQEMTTFVDNYVQHEKLIGRDILLHPSLATELEGLWKEMESRYGVKFGQRSAGLNRVSF
jgi:hypothetical protein